MGQKLGQHFLINKSAIGKIISALDLKKNDTIIEIGPGKGALTIPLSEKCSEIDDRCKIIAIEKDPELAFSVKRLGYSENLLEIVNADALKCLMEITKHYTLIAKPYKVVGNIPYYITGKLLRILRELENKPELIVLTIQKEVAERLMAKPPRMNLLAAAIQIWAKPEIIGNLKAEDFDPPPDVDSAIIRLIPEPKLSQNDLDKYYKLIKISFKQPRKTLLNNLSTSLGKLRVKSKEEILKILQKIGLKGDERPQNLSLSQALQISLLLL